MIFQLRNRTRGNYSRRRVIYFLLVLFSIIILWLQEPFRYWMFRIVSVVTVPIWKISDVITPEWETNKTDVDRIALTARVETLENENATLKFLLNRPGEPTSKLGLVLSSLRSSPYDTFIIDLGSDQGVAFGDRVISVNGVSLGAIIEVYPKISKVELYSAFGQNLEAQLDIETRVLMNGQGSQNFFLSLPRGVTVSSSSTLSLPGFDQFIIAIVNRIENDPGDAFQRVYARSPVNIHSLRHVLVLPG